MKKTKILLAATAFTLVFSACKKDDDNTDIGFEPHNSTDATFTAGAATSNETEVGLGRLAASMATNASVRAFGQMMVTEHSNAQGELSKAANNAQLQPVADTTLLHTLRTQLMSLSGRAFDSVYITSQVTAHQGTLSLLQTEITGGSSASLKGYAQAQVPVVQTHLALADSLRRHL
jgi:putative membrane protein